MLIKINDREHIHKVLKDKNVSEFARNMESEGWPSEFPSKEAQSRVEHFERKKGRPMRRKDAVSVMPLKYTSREEMNEIAKSKGLEHFEKGFPDVNDNGELIRREG